MTIFTIVWCVGVISTVTGRRRLLRYLAERNRAEEEKLSLVEQLLQARNLESLGVLAGGIAHDFNNIMGTIIGHCGILQLRPQRVAESVPEIEKAAERAAELCRQMLAYAGKSPAIIAPVDMSLLVADMVRTLQATMRQNVVIDTRLEASVHPVNGDSEQLRQIVVSLITNAAEAIGTEQGTIKISLAETAVREGDSYTDHAGKIILAGRYVCLEVTDDGCGMNAEVSSRIFEPFYTTKFFGRGLGLPATLGIITAHQGALQLVSQAGRGTTFKVYLPA